MMRTSLAFFGFCACALGVGCGDSGTEHDATSSASASTGSSTAQGGGGSGGGSGGSSSACPFTSKIADRLSVKDADILDPSGKPIQLRGWNWGQWGTLQPQDGVDNLKQGANVARIPLRWWGEYDNQSESTDPKVRTDSRDDSSPATGYIEPGHLTTLDAMIQEAVCQGLWVDIFFDSDCGQGSDSSTTKYCGTGSDGKVASFTNDASSLAKFTTAWETLAKRYANQPRIAMYEILPEPNFGCKSKKNCKDWKAAPRFYKPIIDKIRAIDPKTPILIGPDGGYEVSMIDTAVIDGESNLIYTADYLNQTASDPSTVSDYLVKFRRAKHALFIQQVAIQVDKSSETEALAATKTILDDLNAAEIGWTWWTYRDRHTENSSPYWASGSDSGPWSSDPKLLDAVTSHFH